MSKGKTAEDLLKEAKQVNSEILQIESFTLDNLLDQRKGLELKIRMDLSKGKKLSDPLLDYCFANFDGYSHINPLGERVESNSTFDVVPFVKNFLNDVEDSIGKKILETYDNVPKQIGIISGNCFFEIKERRFRDLYVPVKNLLIFKEGEWKEEKDKFKINKAIFEYPVITLFKINEISRLTKDYSKRIKYETNHSKNFYFGAPGPKETAIYIGNNYVDEILKDKEITIKTEKKIKVPIPILSSL